MPDPDAPQEIGEYRILARLADTTYHAVGAGGRAVVLKQIDPTCMLGEQLHSQIRDRLKAIRGLAHPQVAHLLAVERDGDFAFAAWEYLDAQRFDQWATRDGREQLHVIHMARELVLAVEGLHALGIVHGRLTAANVFVHDGRIRLTHLSPLLYTDPREDAIAVMRLLRQVVAAREEDDSPLGRLVADAEAHPMAPAELRGALAALVDPQNHRPAGDDPPHELTPRGRSITAAVIAAIVGVLIAVAIWQYTTANTPAPPLPPDLQME